MKRNLWKGILIAACAAAFCAALAACGGGEHYDYLVTFDYNYSFEGDYARTQYLGLTESYPYAVAPAAAGDFKMPEFDQTYALVGWYLPQLDGEGNPVTEEVHIPWARAKNCTEEEKAQGYKVVECVALGEKWDFSDPITQNITLYAKYESLPALVALDEEGKECQRKTGENGVVREPVSESSYPKKEGYTFVEYYTDEDRTQRFDGWPVIIGGEDVTLYAKFVEGTWSVVKTADAFTSALSQNADIYIPDFVGEIDLSGATSTLCKSYNAELQGNGCVLTGIKLETTSSTTGTNPPYSLFGEFGSSAKIENVTVEAEIEYTVSATGQFSVSLLADKAAAGAVFKNVTTRGKITFKNQNPSALPTVTLSAFIRDDNSTKTGCDWSGVVLDDQTQS